MFHLNDEILFFQQITRPRNKVVPVHNHNCYEIVYYKKCDGSIELDGKPWPFKSNTFSFQCKSNGGVALNVKVSHSTHHIDVFQFKLVPVERTTP